MEESQRLPLIHTFTLRLPCARQFWVVCERMLGIMVTDTVRVLKAHLWPPAFGNLNYRQCSESPGGGGEVA